MWSASGRKGNEQTHADILLEVSLVLSMIYELHAPRAELKLAGLSCHVTENERLLSRQKLHIFILYKLVPAMTRPLSLSNGPDDRIQGRTLASLACSLPQSVRPPPPSPVTSPRRSIHPGYSEEERREPEPTRCLDYRSPHDAIERRRRQDSFVECV